jgi:hypothetical protein
VQVNNKTIATGKVFNDSSPKHVKCHFEINNEAHPVHPKSLILQLTNAFLYSISIKAYLSSD